MADKPVKKTSVWIEKIKKIKHFEWIVAGIAILIMLGLYFAAFGSDEQPSAQNSPAAVSDYCAQTERDLASAISAIKGAGECQVMITWSASVELILAMTTTSNSGGSTSTPQLISSGGGTQPIVLKQLYPDARSVLVVCQGGDDVKVRLSIINAVSTLLDVPSDKVVVLSMRK